MKNFMLVAYIIITLVLVHLYFSPEIAVLWICAIIAFIKFFGQIVLNFDLGDKKHLVWIKFSFLLIITTILFTGPWLMRDELWKDFVVKSTANVQVVGNLRAVVWTMVFTIIGIDVYILYSYLFERNKKTLT